MEWVFQDFHNEESYIDDIIIEGKGHKLDELIENHTKDLKAVLYQLGKHELLASENKAQLFM